MDNRREQIIDIVKREFIGPDPINVPGLIQENGEEILSSDPPRIRYIAGILFPQKLKESEILPDTNQSVYETDEEDDHYIEDDTPISSNAEYLQEAEELMNLSNSYQQSAMSMSIAIRNGDSIYVSVSAGTYIKLREEDANTGKDHYKYPRIPISWNNENLFIDLPNEKTGIKKYQVRNKEKDVSLRFIITYRYALDNGALYTFSLENTNILSGSLRDEDCFFQVEFSLQSSMGFLPIPENKKLNINDDDYLSNRLLYQHVKTYAIGHGCAADWKEINGEVKQISSSVFPSYEIKPILPSSIDGVSLSMKKMSDKGDKNSTLIELNLLCERYEKWINELESKMGSVDDYGTASRHIKSCIECLNRMKDGVKLLESNDSIMLAFQLMNRAMLLQQLHYNLPIQNWTVNSNNNLELENGIEKLPQFEDESTWYDIENHNYGHWRPFQLAFILMNIKSMAFRDCDERSIVDLIWFPTGGGKTEAYLGLSAFTIFIRRLLDKNNDGTTILMRYTLRLLTSQQYERASSMICACDSIRREKEDILGSTRISIGLWVGGETSPNNMADAIREYDKLYNGSSDINPFVVLKCPWCGAQMGVVNKNGRTRETPGYKKIKRGSKKQLVFQCSNTKNQCEFSVAGNELPLYVIDEDIYEKRPTLLLGTVDKFAMLPYRPQAQSIFGIDDGKRKTAPDLIIQDELHLISGPLGSMVGHYETLINELCSYNDGNKTIKPKIITSTATVSKASEQCHALYGCGIENVKQFPPSGLKSGDSFFAREDINAVGREYVGILANASSSIATTTIRLYASLLYAAKAIEVKDENERDPYWTNVGYFNSIRELGQTETWIKADIDEYLHVIYKRRYEDKDPQYKEKRRYIWRDEELTSRIRSDKIPQSLQNLSIKYDPKNEDKRPIDICLATNMISVGVDVPRLGLMTVSGQPKTTSEYIQATSRVGRDKNAPGLVFTIYNPGKPRDKSHYEQFVSYHSKVYCNVEPTSVTPFSAPLRERALHALVIGILRLENEKQNNIDPPRIPSPDEIKRIKQIVSDRINCIDNEELAETLLHIDSIFEKWKIEEPMKYQDFNAGDELPLMFPAGTMRNEAWGVGRGFPTPTSMRSVDASCEAYVLENGYYEEDS